MAYLLSRQKEEIEMWLVRLDIERSGGDAFSYRLFQHEERAWNFIRLTISQWCYKFNVRAANIPQETQSNREVLENWNDLLASYRKETFYWPRIYLKRIQIEE